MVIIPNSRIILLISPLQLDSNNQLTFATKTDQYNYFYNLQKWECNDASYQRKDGVIRFPTHTEIGDGLPNFEDLLSYNYCMYQNTAYDNKWFYAYVTKVNYVNDGMTEIAIETDVFQTWQFDIVYKNSFIEREHVSVDTIGAHTVPEGLETGEYIINSTGLVTNKFRRDACYVCIGVTHVPDNTPGVVDARYYGNIFSGLILLVAKTFEDAGKFLKAYDKMGRGNDVVSVYLLPSDFIPSNQTWLSADYDTITGIQFCILPVSLSSKEIDNNISIPINTTINGYTPKNNKLYTYPYNYLSITNNCGTQATFMYEQFTSNAPLFVLKASESAGIPSMLIPKNYKLYSGTQSSLSHNYLYNYGISGGKFPMCSWQTDLYTNWMTQNGVNIFGHNIDAPTAMALGGTIETVIGGAAVGATGLGSDSKVTGTGIGGVGSGLAKMFGAVQENYRHSLESPRLNGQTTVSDLSFTNDQLTFTYYKMSIKEEYAKIIDNFFTMYGYKVNNLATPNIHKRSNWDYMKCIDINLEGNIPESDIIKLRNLFNNGCTFWHTTTYFLDYSRTNSIL